MADLFHEVDEQIRSAQFQRVVRQGWPYAAVLVAVLAVVAIVAWALNQNELKQAATASERYAAALGTLEAGDPTHADGVFAQVARDGPRAYRALALMQQGGIRVKRGDAAAAVPYLDQAAQAAPNDILGDVARLQAAYIVMDGGNYPAIRARLTPLAAVGRPYRIMAREALAMIELASGRVAQAHSDLQLVSLSSDASDIAHNRAQAALALIQSGGWTSLAPLVKGSAGLTPRTPPPNPAAPGSAAPDASGQAAAPTASDSDGSSPAGAPQ